jgi:hypothetical protein
MAGMMRKTRGLKALSDCLDRAAFSRRVAALEDDNDAQPLALHPVLKLAEFDLKFARFAFVFLAREFRLLGSGVGILGWQVLRVGGIDLISQRLKLK